MDDDFAAPAPTPASLVDVAVEIKSNIDLVEHAFQAKHTKTEEDSEKTRVMHYGDMSDTEGKARPFYERIFSTDKHRTVRKQSEPFPLEEGKKMMVIGTNRHGAYAIQSSVESAVCIDGYHQVMGQYERNSLVRSLKHDLKHVCVAKDAKRKWEYIVALMSNDPSLKELLMPFINAFKKKADKLPAVPSDEREYNGGTYLETRPGGKLPIVQCMTTQFKSSNNNMIIGETYSLWFCDPKKKNHQWSLTKLPHIECAVGEIPQVAFNDEYLVTILKYEKTNLFCARVYSCSSNGKPLSTPEHIYHFEFPEEHFTLNGIYQVHLSAKNILSVACSKGAIVFDILNEIELPRIIVLESEEDRLVTSVQIYHPMGRTRLEKGADTWDSTNINEDGEFIQDKDEDPPAWSGTLVLGTSVGECLGMSWRNGKICFIELTPACEPIYSSIYSNQRILMHCVGSLSGKLLPYFHEGITQMEMARPRAVAMLGTQVYVLDKYGSIQIFSTLARNILSPFKPPRTKVYNEETEEDEYKPIDIGLTLPCQAAYPGLYVEQTRIRTLYPNGVLDTIEIDQRALALIETKVYGDKKKQQKKEKKKQQKKEKDANMKKKTTTTTKNKKK